MSHHDHYVYEFLHKQQIHLANTIGKCVSFLQCYICFCNLKLLNSFSLLNSICFCVTWYKSFYFAIFGLYSCPLSDQT